MYKQSDHFSDGYKFRVNKFHTYIEYNYKYLVATELTSNILYR